MSLISISNLPTLGTEFTAWGGGSLGFRQAGFHELFGIDTNKHSRDCFKLNHPETPIHNLDLSKVTGKDVLNLAGIESGELDVYLTTPPCQGISRAGLNNPNHPLNELTLQAIDRIAVINPKVFVLENVASIDEARMLPFFEKLMGKVIRLSEYNVEYRKLNFAHFGGCQKRERFIMIGVRRDVGVPVFPQPSFNVQTVSDILPSIKTFTFGYQTYPKYKTGDDLMVTITKTENVWAIEDGMRRKLTVEELLTLCGYPKDWKVTGSRNQIWQRAGNSLMPPMAYAIARTIKDEILTKNLLMQAA